MQVVFEIKTCGVVESGYEEPEIGIEITNQLKDDRKKDETARSTFLKP